MKKEHCEVLIAMVNNPIDLAIIRDEGWYRIPVASVPKRFPPEFIAFYQTRIFKESACQVRYYGEVDQIKKVFRTELFPKEPQNGKSDKEYFQIRIKELRTLKQPIKSQKPRRIVFIPTTKEKFFGSELINDVFDESPLEDLLWYALKKNQISAERQWELIFKNDRFILDFAMLCEKGFIDVETDGDTYHTDKEKSQTDNARNNLLESKGWHVLRFNTHAIKEQMEQYCIPTIKSMTEKLGGMIDEEFLNPTTYVQEPLFHLSKDFDSGITYNIE